MPIIEQQVDREAQSIEPGVGFRVGVERPLQSLAIGSFELAQHVIDHEVGVHGVSLSRPDWRFVPYPGASRVRREALISPYLRGS